MVHISDEGSAFDVPIDSIWQFLQSPGHAAAHKDQRNAEMKPVSETSVVITAEQNMGGNWVKTTRRITRYPPTGVAVEMLDGPLAGSKFFQLYHPKGDKTQIVVVGDFVSPHMTDADIEKAVRGVFEHAYEEDAAALRAFQHKK